MKKFSEKTSINITKETFDNDNENEFSVVMTPDAIPDLGIMLKDIQDMLKFIESSELCELEEKILNESLLADTIEYDMEIKNEEYKKIFFKMVDMGESSEEYSVVHQNEMDNTKKKIAKLRKSSANTKEKFESLIYGKYNSILPMKIISLMIEQERYNNLTELLNMFDVLNDVKVGKKDINTAAEEFGENRREKYVYPKFDGKENFIRQMSEGPQKNNNEIASKSKRKRLRKPPNALNK